MTEIDPASLEALRTCVVPVYQYDGEAFHEMGTAFFVRPGFLLTADHVLSEGLDRSSSIEDDSDQTPRPLGHRRHTTSPRTTLVLISPPGGDGAAVPTTQQLLHSAGSDVAVMRVDPDRVEQILGGHPHCAKLTGNRPRIAANCTTFGYGGMKAHHTIPSKDGRTIAVGSTLPLTVSRGIIEEVHPAGRDHLILPYPYFQIGGEYTGGMSGGPVFGEDGNVHGILSRGSNPIDADQPPFGYASLVAPAMMFPIDDGENGEVSIGQYLQRRGRLVGDEDWVVNRNEEGRASVIWDDDHQDGE